VTETVFYKAGPAAQQQTLQYPAQTLIPHRPAAVIMRRIIARGKIRTPDLSARLQGSPAPVSDVLFSPRNVYRSRGKAPALLFTSADLLKQARGLLANPAILQEIGRLNFKEQEYTWIQQTRNVPSKLILQIAVDAPVLTIEALYRVRRIKSLANLRRIFKYRAD
jgi:hypothetical protein